jgi:spermidine synthase
LVFKTQVKSMDRRRSKTPEAVVALFVLFFVSGFTALLYQVVWQRMLGLFSGSDIRSITLVIAAYLLGLGLGGMVGGRWSDHLSRHRAIQVYGFSNLGIGVFAFFSRFLFYDLLFHQFSALVASLLWTLMIAFASLLIPTFLMGMSLPLLAKAISPTSNRAAPWIGLLYGVNTLGSGVGTLLGGWYIIGTLGYEQTVYLGAILNVMVGCVALNLARSFQGDRFPKASGAVASTSSTDRLIGQWSLLVFLSGFSAISLEIIWFRILDTVLQSIAYTYAHLLAFILISNALGSILGAALVRFIHRPKQVFLWIQGFVIAYALISIWLLSLYLQVHPTDLRTEIGYIDLNHVNPEVWFKYFALPFLVMAPPNILLGFYFPLVQRIVQTHDRQIGQRVGLIQVANILGNTVGSLLTGLILLEQFGTAGSLRLLAFIGLFFVLLSYPMGLNVKRSGGVAIALIATLVATVVALPNNSRLWAGLHGIQPQQYLLAAEDSTGIAAITEAKGQGTLLASGQAQANFPYLVVHALLGCLPALSHPAPRQVMIIGLGSGGTAHTIGVNPLTQTVQVIELLGAELNVLKQYAQRPLGEPLKMLFQDPRYRFIVGDGRRELMLSQSQFDLIETDAIYPWRSRAGMLYSQEFFQEVQAHLAPGGIFVEWDVGPGIAQTFRNVFPYVTQLNLGHKLYVLMGSEHPVAFDRPTLLNKLNSTEVLNFLDKAQVDVAPIREAVRTADVHMYSHAQNGQPKPVNTDLFPRSEYYLNHPTRPSS